MLKVALIVLVCGGGVVVNSESTFSIYETPQFIEFHGYPAETHHVTTSDGYILEMHRIPHGKGQEYTPDRPVVFLMHGLTAASNCYIFLGPELAPAFNFADGGFDVWMGNARGTKNSRHHVSLDPDNSRQKNEFFDFSWEEIAIYDLPAMIDYALATTNKKKLYYVGHSQGGTVFLVLNSMRPEYQEKFQSAHLWAGVGYMKHFPQAQLSLIARFTDTIYNAAVLARQVELFPPKDTKAGADVSLALSNANKEEKSVWNAAFKFLCQIIGERSFVGELTRNSREGTNEDEPGAALKQFAHYGQNIRDEAFARWSYGSIQNLFVYGSRSAPKYDLSLIKINVIMHYTVNDNLLDEQDVLAMAEVMPNTKVRKVARESFLHTDFVLARDAKELVTNYVVEAWRRESGL